jgi:hypothetical protein
MKNLLWAFFLFWLLAVAGYAESLPSLAVTDLADHPANLASMGSGTVSVFVVGFTIGSSAKCRAWGIQLWGPVTTDFHGHVFSVAQFEGVPKFVIPLIASSLRVNTPQARFKYIFLSRQGRDQLKKLLDYDSKAGSDDPYLLIVDAQKQIRWKTHGPFTPGKMSAIKAKLRDLTKTTAVH